VACIYKSVGEHYRYQYKAALLKRRQKFIGYRNAARKLRVVCDIVVQRWSIFITLWRDHKNPTEMRFLWFWKYFYTCTALELTNLYCDVLCVLYNNIQLFKSEVSHVSVVWWIARSVYLQIVGLWWYSYMIIIYSGGCELVDCAVYVVIKTAYIRSCSSRVNEQTCAENDYHYIMQI